MSFLTVFIVMHDHLAQPFMGGQLDRYDAVPAGRTESPPCATVEQGGEARLDARDQHQIIIRRFIYAIASFHARGNECI